MKYCFKCLETTRAQRPLKKFNTLTKFLENDRKVLCFDCLWNDGLGKIFKTIYFRHNKDTKNIYHYRQEETYLALSYGR